MDCNPVGWFEIHVQDMPRAKKFYETVFGVKLDKLPTHVSCDIVRDSSRSGAEARHGQCYERTSAQLK